MRPKEILQRWVEYFNQYDYERLGELYAEDCINHQTPNGIVKGKDNIKNMFKNEFEQFEMVCIVENIFEEGNRNVRVERPERSARLWIFLDGK